MHVYARLVLFTGQGNDAPIVWGCFGKNPWHGHGFSGFIVGFRLAAPEPADGPPTHVSRH